MRKADNTLYRTLPYYRRYRLPENCTENPTIQINYNPNKLKMQVFFKAKMIILYSVKNSDKFISCFTVSAHNGNRHGFFGLLIEKTI